MFLNKSSIYWYSNKQDTFESSMFGSGFCSMCMTVEVLNALWYNLFVFGIPINGPEGMFVIIGRYTITL